MDIYSLISSAAKEKLKYHPKIAARIPADIARLQAEARAEAEAAYNAQEAEQKKQQQAAKQVEKETKAKQEKLKKEEQKESDRLNKIITNSEKELRKKAKVEETHVNKDYEKHETSIRVKEKEKKTEQLESDLLYQTEQKTLKDLEEKANLERKFILKDSEKASNKLVPKLSHTFKTGDYVVGESVSGTFIKDLGVAKGANWTEVRDEKGRIHSIKVDELKPDLTDSELLGKEIPKSSKEGHIPTTDPTNISNIKGDPEKVHGDGKPPEPTEKVVKATQPTRTENRYVSPESAKTQYDKPLAGLSKKTFADQLKGMGIYVVDVETTGLEKTDKMFSSGRVKIDEKGNIVDPSQAIESHYDIGTADKLDKKLFRSEDSYIEAVEKNLARAHSSKKFGQEQKERGSLRGNAEARSKGTLTTPASFLEGINEDLDKNTGGSVIWGHNNAFEDRQFSTDKLGGDPEYVKQHDDLLNRNVSQTRSIFGSNKGLSNRAEDINERGLTQKASNILYNDINESILSQDPDKLRQALGKYAATNVDIINNIQEDIETVRYQKGKYVSGDSLNLSRALMSFGAVTDQVDPRNLLLGNKIETLAEVLLDGYKETHQALDDAKVQGKITSILTEEIDQFRKDPNYKSEVAAKLDAHITANRGKLANASYKQSVIRQIKDVEDLKDSKGFNEVFSWLDQTTKNYSVIPEGSSHRSAFTRDFRTALDAAYKEKDASIDKVKARMESFIEDYKLEDTAHRIAEPDSSTKAKSLMKKALEGKNKFITIGAGLAAANLVIGGGEKGEDKKYNTYDELYNNQYYGSGFADWQERNNSHKVLY